MDSSGPGSERPAPVVTWQRRLLPFMVCMIAVLTAGFFTATYCQVNGLQQRIQAAPKLESNSLLRHAFGNPGADASEAERLAHARLRSQTALDLHALQRRYHQADAALMSSIWLKYLGFVTGMILALVGSAFVLGKLREPETRLDAEGTALKVAIATTSPGLILAVLGAILMMTTIVTHHSTEVTDSAVWLASSKEQASSGDTGVTRAGMYDDVQLETEDEDE